MEQRYQKVKEELNSLSAHLETLVLDKRFAVSPKLEVLSKSTPAGALFRMCVGDCSLEIGKAVLGSLVLLPPDEGLPQMDTGEKLLEKARTKQADLAEEIYTYVLDFGCPASNCDFKTVASKLSRKVTKNYCSAFPGPPQNPKSKKSWSCTYREGDRSERVLRQGFEAVGERWEVTAAKGSGEC